MSVDRFEASGAHARLACTWTTTPDRIDAGWSTEGGRPGAVGEFQSPPERQRQLRPKYWRGPPTTTTMATCDATMAGGTASAGAAVAPGNIAAPTEATPLSSHGPNSSGRPAPLSPTYHAFRRRLRVVLLLALCVALCHALDLTVGPSKSPQIGSSPTPQSIHMPRTRRLGLVVWATVDFFAGPRIIESGLVSACVCTSIYACTTHLTD